MDLFGNNANEVIRTIGFYQPFCTAMLHGKIETRWVRKGRKPSMPLGKYLMYSTKKRCSNADLFNWCGTIITHQLYDVINNDDTKQYDGYALCTGTLVKVELLTPEHNPTFIKFVGEKTETIDGEQITKIQWALIFENVTPIEPFVWLHGKQGVGFVPDTELQNIKLK